MVWNLLNKQANSTRITQRDLYNIGLFFSKGAKIWSHPAYCFNLSK